MNKKIKSKFNEFSFLLLLITVICTIIWFAVEWFKYELLDILFIFALFLYLVLICIYIACFIAACMDVYKNKSYLSIVTILVIILGTFIIIKFPFIDVKFSFEFKTFYDEREEVINLIKNNELKPDENNIVQLPLKYKKISNSGEVPVYVNKDNLQIIGFWIYRGTVVDEQEILIYTSEDEQSIKDNIKYIDSITKIDDQWYYGITV